MGKALDSTGLHILWKVSDHIVNELEVQHPTSKLLLLVGKAQQEEIGDGANLTISFVGELLEGVEELIRTTLHPSEILNELVERGS